MSTYTEIKPAGRLECETSRTTSPNKAAVPCSLKIECPQEDDESSFYYNPTSIQGIKHPSECTKKFPAHIERARRRCLTQVPCNMVRDAILPSHFSKMLSPIPPRSDCEYGLYPREPVTPTKEMILELLCLSPKFTSNPSFSNQSSLKPSKPTNVNNLSLLPLLVEPSVVPNQLADLLNTSAPGAVYKNPAKRRVRATYGVRLESIRVNVEPESTRRSHSQDEYQPSVREGVRLAPIAHAARL